MRDCSRSGPRRPHVCQAASSAEGRSERRAAAPEEPPPAQTAAEAAGPAEPADALSAFTARGRCASGALLIRVARPEDAAGAAVVLTRAFAGQPGGIPIGDVAQYVQEMQQSVPRGVLLVARITPDEPGGRERVVGTAALSLTPDSRERFPSLQPPEDAGLLCNIAVDLRLRRQGIATQLLAAAEALAAAAGCAELFLHVRLADAAAQRLYARQGYEEVARDGLLAGLRGIIPRALLCKSLAR